jgi:ABC-type multidrug transport system fused ATPase/permease subunit
MNFRHPVLIIGMFLIPMLVVLIPIVLGQLHGIRRKKKEVNMEPGSVGTVVATTFALLAFMLAFTFQIVSNRYDKRKELLLEEVTNIRTTYLRSGLLPEPYRSENKKLLVEYIDLRAELAKDVSKSEFSMLRSREILDSLWTCAEELAAQDRSSEVYAMFTGSVNDLVDNFNQRVTMTFEYRIPVTVTWALLIITFFSMLTLGYHFGISGKGSYRINLLISAVFAMVMFLIFALDRPETGLARLSQKPVLSLHEQLHKEYVKDVINSTADTVHIPVLK